MKKTIVMLVFLCLYQLQAQEHAWVYFTDKPQAEELLQDPHTILTQRAIDRREHYNIPIDERDVPVDETYISTVKNQNGITVKAKSKWLNCVHVIGTEEAIQLLTQFNFVDHIDFADQNLNGRSEGVYKAASPTEKLGTQEFYTYGDSYNQVAMIKLNALHENNFTGTGMWIAVLDGGFPNVNDLAAFQHLRNHNGILGGYDFVNRSQAYDNPQLSSHGTKVLSEMAGYIVNDFVGTAPDADYYLFRTEDTSSETPVEESYWVEAAERADSLGVDMINSSLGYNLYDEPRYSYSPNDMNGNTAFVTKGANIAVEKGILVVVAAGNSAENQEFPIISAPADGNVFTVGAVDADENYASFSSIGPSADGRIKPDVAVQGQGNAFVNEVDELSFGNGTSFAAPTLTGALACLWQYLPDKNNMEIMQLVRESSSLYENPTDELGYGIPDFQLLTGLPLAITDKVQDWFTCYPNPFHNTLYIKTPNVASFSFRLYNILGQLLIKKETITSKIDLSSLSKGIYIAKFESEDFKKTIKLIKQ